MSGAGPRYLPTLPKKRGKCPPWYLLNFQRGTEEQSEHLGSNSHRLVANLILGAGQHGKQMLPYMGIEGRRGT